MALLTNGECATFPVFHSRSFFLSAVEQVIIGIYSVLCFFFKQNQPWKSVKTCQVHVSCLKIQRSQKQVEPNQVEKSMNSSSGGICCFRLTACLVLNSFIHWPRSDAPTSPFYKHLPALLGSRRTRGETWLCAPEGLGSDLEPPLN